MRYSVILVTLLLVRFTEAMRTENRGASQPMSQGTTVAWQLVRHAGTVLLKSTSQQQQQQKGKTQLDERIFPVSIPQELSSIILSVLKSSNALRLLKMLLAEIRHFHDSTVQNMRSNGRLGRIAFVLSIFEKNHENPIYRAWLPIVTRCAALHVVLELDLWTRVSTEVDHLLCDPSLVAKNAVLVSRCHVTLDKLLGRINQLLTIKGQRLAQREAFCKAFDGLVANYGDEKMEPKDLANDYFEGPLPVKGLAAAVFEPVIQCARVEHLMFLRRCETMLIQAEGEALRLLDAADFKALRQACRVRATAQKHLMDIHSGNFLLANEKEKEKENGEENEKARRMRVIFKGRETALALIQDSLHRTKSDVVQRFEMHAQETCASISRHEQQCFRRQRFLQANVLEPPSSDNWVTILPLPHLEPMDPKDERLGELVHDPRAPPQVTLDLKPVDPESSVPRPHAAPMGSQSNWMSGLRRPTVPKPDSAVLGSSLASTEPVAPPSPQMPEESTLQCQSSSLQLIDHPPPRYNYHHHYHYHHQQEDGLHLPLFPDDGILYEHLEDLCPWPWLL